MKVQLAGFNVDTDVLEKMRAGEEVEDSVTPEVLSAAYARISRSPRGVTELRKIARREVDKARRSNCVIIFEMGHHSVAEHAVFNFDIMEVSRLAIEALEHFRLCSYTEKSQRYVTLEGDFVVPGEIMGTGLERPFVDTVEIQNDFYRDVYDALLESLVSANSEEAGKRKGRRLLEGEAKEDARYTLSLATQGQLGQTINARNLELMLRRFASHELSEVRALGRLMHDLVADIAPSIILFHDANPFDGERKNDLRKCLTGLDGSDRNIRESCNCLDGNAGNLQASTHENAVQRLGDPIPSQCAPGLDSVRLVDHTPDGDRKILASILHASSSIPYGDCLAKIYGMSREEKFDLFKSVCRRMEFFDRPVREFEHASLTFEIVLSASCYAQMKRHRMLTLSSQPYDLSLGVTIPASIERISRVDDFRKVATRTEETYRRIYDRMPCVAPYILTNAHRRRILLKTNVRELYHISRLREDSHAQWEIRGIARAMARLAKEVLPITTSLLAGKDRYPDTYRQIFGEYPPAGPPPE